MSFNELFEQVDWERIQQKILRKTSRDVKRALSKPGGGGLEDFMALLSPAAQEHLEEMAQLSHRLTQKRFGKTIQLYLPLYLSNHCLNSCLYCGFRKENKTQRTVLDKKQVLEEAEAIKKMGFEHLLLVTGEDPKRAGLGYLKEVMGWLRPYFSQLSIEVQPMKTEEYQELTALGLNTVLVYQETYRKDSYKTYHPKGKKADFEHRLETPDRLGQAEIHKIGLGCLLGLEDWRTDSWFVGMHLDYLKKKYWKTKFSISFPRLRPAVGILEPKHPMEDKELLQLICAYRILDENLELSLSTRESVRFRDHAIKLGITSVSAGSKTEPGGYASPAGQLKQFEIHDDRSPEEVAAMIRKQGYESVWKDWEAYYGT